MGLLGRHGHAVTVANNGKEAVHLWESQEFDVILMDVQMPDMDGMEATAVIRAQELKTGHHVPIIAMTAHAMKGDREQCLAAGMDDYIAKPIRIEQLFGTLQRVLGHKSEQPAVPESCAGGNGRVVDFSVAMKAVDGDSELLGEIVQAFLEETPRIIDQIRGALQTGDSNQLQRAAHTVKGSLRTLGASAAAEFAQELESIGKHKTATGAAEAFARLQRAVEDVNSSLVEYLHARPHIV
jgi:CheY-like chemotaxis protein/HPt (histidine-containing phosphotransfer) domain-containing protein